MRERILFDNSNIPVIGVGVIALTTAICLRKAGFNVVITANNFEANLSSIVSN